MGYTSGEVANYAVRVLLERVGRRYDAVRGLSVSTLRTSRPRRPSWSSSPTAARTARVRWPT